MAAAVCAPVMASNTRRFFAVSLAVASGCHTPPATWRHEQQQMIQKCSWPASEVMKRVN
jgi:hypothetical protein